MGSSAISLALLTSFVTEATTTGHALCFLGKGLPDSPLMKFSKKLESVCKDIEGVFGILKVSRFQFLKTFNLLRRQDSIYNAFVTCCAFHNILLRHDNDLARDLTRRYAGGLEESLAPQYATRMWNGSEGMLWAGSRRH